MRFEILTCAPLDLDAILPEKMSGDERMMLNRYHESVYERISPFLEKDERDWLREYTRPV